MKINNKGFTLMELLATIILLTIIMGLGSYTIIGLIDSARERDYQLLVDEIKDAVSTFHMECKYSASSGVTCPTASGNYYQIKLNDLVKYGYLKANKTNNGLINPKDNKAIGDCKIRYKYDSGEIKLENVASTNSSCPMMNE